MKAIAVCLVVATLGVGIAKAAPPGGGRNIRPAAGPGGHGHVGAAVQHNGVRAAAGHINVNSINANAVAAAAALRRSAATQPNFSGGAGLNFPGRANIFGFYPYVPGYNYDYGLLNRPIALPRVTAPMRPTPADSTLVIGIATVPSREFSAGREITVPSREISAGLAKNGKVTMQVVPPTADADILVEGVQTANMGRERLFITPTLEAGYRYSYTIVATWSKNGQPKRESRTIEVTPGLTTTIDFTRPAVPELLPMPMKVERDQF